MDLHHAFNLYIFGFGSEYPSYNAWMISTQSWSNDNI